MISLRLSAKFKIVGSFIALAVGSICAIGRGEEIFSAVAAPSLQASTLDQHLRGKVLLEELNCVACHSADASLQAASKVAPRLAAVGARVNPYYLEAFVQNPHASKPGSTMPNAMSYLPADERKEAARAITHYLLSLSKKKPPFKLLAIDAVAAEAGEQLFGSVGCIACHSPRNDNGEETMPAASTPLGALEKKFNTQSLAAFLREPHKTRPSGRMPNLKLNNHEAEQIAHYLLRKTKTPGHLHYTLLRGRVWEGLEENVTKEKAGLVDDFDLKQLPQVTGNSAILYEGYLNIETAGAYTFFLEMNGGQLLLNDKEAIDLPASSRRGVKQVEATLELPKGWNKIKLTYIHAGKEPRLKFEMASPEMKRQPIPAKSLTISPTPVSAYQPYLIDEATAEKGRAFFTQLNCVKCHNDVPAVDELTREITPLASLNLSGGCLSDSDGRWPRFPLSQQQKDSIRSVLKKPRPDKLSERQQLDKSLVKFNCVACHQRDELGGVSPERNPHFTGLRGELGNEGRIPPPLTHVGVKLQNSWIKEVMLNGKEQREYLSTRMPQFGAANVGDIVDLFEKVDTIEPADFEKIEDVAAVKAAGHQLVGVTGFSCIACHDFNGQKASGPGALDIIHSTERLKKDWFYWFMLNPARFRKNTIMPSAWPGGHVFKKEILADDSKKQIEAIWVYLKDGERAKNPIGLSRKSPELRVTDEAVMCRGRGNAGYRGIAVGYPERLSLAFDSEQMNLTMIWKGKFATAEPNRFSAIGDNRIGFEPGVPFHRLKSLDDNWPYKRKTDYLFHQDHGYKFGGYYLGAKRRPTFMYRYQDVRVEETFEDIAGDEKPAYFRRTFKFNAPAAQEKFYFRAATGNKITAKEIADDAQTGYTVDRLTVLIEGSHKGVVRDGEPNELLLPIELPEGESTLVLEYHW